MTAYKELANNVKDQRGSSYLRLPSARLSSESISVCEYLQQDKAFRMSSSVQHTKTQQGCKSWKTKPNSN